MEIIPTNCP